MTRAGVSQDQVSDAFHAWQNAGPGEKGICLDQHAEIVGVTKRSLYRMFFATGRTEKKSSQIKPRPAKYPDWKIWTENVAAYKYSPPVGNGCLRTQDAIEMAYRGGLIPSQAASVPVATFNRWLRKRKYDNKEKRVRRIRSDTPNEAWYADASTSNFFGVVRQLDDGDWLLAIKSKNESAYKNKPNNQPRKRIWYYCAVDDHSSAKIAKIFISNGENSIDFLRFFDYAMAREDRTESMPYGKPDKLVLDNGVVTRAIKSSDAFQRCNIELVGRQPYNSRAGGRVENAFKQIWQSAELKYWALAEQAFANGEKKFFIKLSDLSATLEKHIIESNNLPHPTIQGITKYSSWLKITTTGINNILPGEIFNGFAEFKKRVASDGTFKHRSQIWEVDGFHDGIGYICDSVHGIVTFRDLQGNGYHCKPFIEHAFGTYAAQPNSATENNKIIPAGSIHSINYIEDHSIAHIAPRTTSTTKADLPFTKPDYFNDTDSAIRYLINGIGPLNWRRFSPDQVSQFRSMIEQDLSIEYVNSIISNLKGESDARISSIKR